MPSPTPDRTRREGVPAVDVELADGESWGLALPGPRLHPAIRREVDPFGRPCVRIEVVARVGYPLEIRRLRDEVATACDGDDPARPRDAFLRLATALLRAAHDIGADEPNPCSIRGAWTSTGSPAHSSRRPSATPI